MNGASHRSPEPWKACPPILSTCIVLPKMSKRHLSEDLEAPMQRVRRARVRWTHDWKETEENRAKGAHGCRRHPQRARASWAKCAFCKSSKLHQEDLRVSGGVDKERLVTLHLRVVVNRCRRTARLSMYDQTNDLKKEIRCSSAMMLDGRHVLGAGVQSA